MELAAALTNDALAAEPDLVTDDDLQLALLLSYGLSYGDIGDADEAWEWHPAHLAVRGPIEQFFERQLRDRVGSADLPEANAEAVASYLFALTADDSGPSLSRYLAKKATDEQAREFVIQRSIYTLKEADPHSWAIPRLTGRPKAALVEVQSDEYGGGRPERVHATIFAGTMLGLGLDDSYGAYIDRVPAVTLASFNMMSMFGINRRLRGAIVGHLAAFEMTSSIPNRLYGNGFRRLGYGENVTWYFDEHVEADAVHEQIAGRDLAGGLAEQHPELLDDIVFGAKACLYADGLVGAHLLERWQAGASSLREASEVAA
nr:iron-containing redox enzyme family protein [Leifsonia poae]